MAKYFNKNLKFIRQQNSISQQELADKLNLDRSTISRWENNEMDATVENAIQVANVLNVSIADLLGKDLTINNNITFNQTQILFDKTKDILSDDDRATIEFIMKKTIDNYEKNKNNLN